jgi:oligogalacturonide lyase
VYPHQRTRFADGATEFEVLRLTDPGHRSVLPLTSSRASSSRAGFLVFSSDRGGSLQVYRLDVRSGEQRQLTEAAALAADSLTLTADERSFAYFDGDQVKLCPIGSLRDRELGRGSSARGLGVADDSLTMAWFDGDELRAGNALKGAIRPIAKPGPAAVRPQFRPKRASILFESAQGLWLANLDGSETRRLKTAPEPHHPQWSPDGQTILYLAGNELREHTPDSNQDAAVAKTSQFASFGRNGDASVFVGASRSKAGPYVLLLLRVTRRELALCEHRASDPSDVRPIFAPSSQRIFFQSDRSGKSALYTMAVDRLVEKTET